MDRIYEYNRESYLIKSQFLYVNEEINIPDLILFTFENENYRIFTLLDD